MNYFKWITAIAFSAISIQSSATGISSDVIMDNYIGAGYHKDVYGSKSRYDIDKMNVTRNGTQLSIDIFTSFYNDVNYKGIKLGDLFMSTSSGGGSAWNPYSTGGSPFQNDRFSTGSSSNTGTDWNYVYDLSSARDGTSGIGKLKSGFDHNDLYVSTNLHSSARQNQGVMLADGRQTTHSTSAWNVGGYSYSKTFNGRNGAYDVHYGKISFSFDVAGTALATAHQIAFRWAMTCANDIIEGMASLSNTPPPSIPEPQTILLMLMGLFGLSMSQKRKNKK